MRWRRLFVGIVLVMSSACQTTVIQVVEQPDVYEPPVLEQETYIARDASLFSKRYHLTLFQDRRAYRVGDLLTVSLNESTQSSKSANTQFDKSSDVSLRTPALLFGSQSLEPIDVGIAGDRSFGGAGSSVQANRLRGAITVMVHDVLPNGTLLIRGEKQLRLNQGDEFIRLSGIVRVEDIDTQNRVSSQRIADAAITYTGEGELAKANEAGWLTRFFNSQWMPF